MEGKKRVLVIDDNRTLVLAAERILQKQGYDVITALNGPDGLQKARKERPDIIILDIIMPEMDGYEVARNLKSDSDTAHIPIIFLSARGNTDETKGPTTVGLEEIGTAFECGGNDFLQKPVSAADLLNTVKNVLWLSRLDSKVWSTANTSENKKWEI